MEIYLLSENNQLVRYLTDLLKSERLVNIDPSELEKVLLRNDSNYILLHVQALADNFEHYLRVLNQERSTVFGVISDIPTLGEMLLSAKHGAKAYCNSYMAENHYIQMIRMLETGVSWFPPALLRDALELAANSKDLSSPDGLVAVLTEREKDIAYSVGQGMSNKRIASKLHISESTVKTHLTRIFAKLDVSSRVALVIKMNRSNRKLARHA